MSDRFDDVQRIVLRGTRWKLARHLLLGFGGKSPLHFLHALQSRSAWPAAAKHSKAGVAVSLGFTRRGLERAYVPAPVLGCFAQKAPAFWAGAAMRSADHLGMVGENAPNHWLKAFRFTALDAVLSVHADDEGRLKEVVGGIEESAGKSGLSCTASQPTATLDAPLPRSLSPAARERAQWVHFGFLDGMSRIGIEGWTAPEHLHRLKGISRHKAGEFVLGHAQDSGANPWIAGPGLSVWPAKIRAFFRNGSFGVLHQISQDVTAFDTFVRSLAATPDLVEVVKGKLCGRYPEGGSLAAAIGTDASADFDYANDPSGDRCPFGSHVRRMNPRLRPPEAADSSSAAATADGLAFFGRSRALLRRGMPYGPLLNAERADDQERGMMGHFFCASIEDQYEHLLGQWADRVPLGSADPGGARDPLIGAHEAGDGPFVIPQSAAPALEVTGLRSFTRTRGVAYLFYPSLTTLTGITESSLWGLDDKGDDR